MDDPPLLVACLCAAWCRTCDDYRIVFDTLRAEFGANARFAWIDIEDDEALLGDVDVVDFPTLLIARGAQPCFFGPVLPHLQAARQLVQRARRAELQALAEAALDGLPERLQASVAGGG